MKKYITSFSIFCILFSVFQFNVTAISNSEYNSYNSDEQIIYDEGYYNGYDAGYWDAYNELSDNENKDNSESLFHEVVDWIYTILVFAPWVLGIGYLLWVFALSPIIDKIKNKSYKSNKE